MKRNQSNFKNNKEKLAGEIKTFAGKVSGNEQLELKGKIQSSKATFKKNTNPGNVVNDVKESIAGKINDMTHKK